MNVFEAVKESVTTEQAARFYGLKVNRNGMTRCPFHDDRYPSMKVDRRFHCFGCQADGDVIDFVARLFRLPVREAAEKLVKDFHVGYDRNEKYKPPVSTRRKHSAEQRFKQTVEEDFCVYADYYHLLKQWQQEYAPKPDDKDWHPLFVESLQTQSYVEFLLDTLLYGTVEDQAALTKDKKDEVKELKRWMEEMKEEKFYGTKKEGTDVGRTGGSESI